MPVAIIDMSPLHRRRARRAYSGSAAFSYPILASVEERDGEFCRPGGHLSTDVVTRRSSAPMKDPSRQACELLNLGVVDALEYGVASADVETIDPLGHDPFPLSV